jgi:hypothetical protein
MPYIKEEDRAKLCDPEEVPMTPGELNYVLTDEAVRYVYNKGLSYQTLSEVVSTFECAKLEFYRRVVVPYEDKKIKENGDVYPPELVNNGGQ